MNIKSTGLLLALLIAGTTLRAQLIDSTDFAGKSNREIIDDMRSMQREIRAFEKLFQKSGSTDKADRKTRIVPAFSLDTGMAMQQYRDVINAEMYLEQAMTDKESKISLETKRIRSLDYSGTGFSIGLVPQKIFFSDGTAQPGSVFNEKDFDLHFGNELLMRKKVDSIQFDVVLTRTKSTAAAILSNAVPVATLQGQKITLSELKGDHAVYTYPDDVHIMLTEGLNAAGKVVDNYRSSSGTGSPATQQKMLTALSAMLEPMLEEMTRDSTLENQVFIKKYAAKTAAKMAPFAQQNSNRFKEISFTGNVQSIKVYTITGKDTLHTNKTISNWFGDDIFINAQNGFTTFYDQNGNELFRKEKEYVQLNTSYYQDDSSYYYFSARTRQMEPQSYFEMGRLNNGFVFAREDEEQKFFILDKDNKKVDNTFFDMVEFDEDIITAIKDNDVLLIPASGRKIWLRNTSVEDFENGYAVIMQGDKYGFADNKGNIVVPAQYDAAEKFSHFSDLLPGDHLFPVRKGDKYGFVDAQNKTVIPFIYDDADPFSYGVTLVKKNGKFGLINTRNEVLADFLSGSQGTSANFGKRMYSLSGGSYDHLGRKEKER